MKNKLKNILPDFIVKSIKRYNIQKIDYKNHGINDLYNKIKNELHKESVVLATGPSLKEFLKNNKEFLKNKNIFCLNSFAESNDFEQVKPNFYMFADPNFWAKEASENIKNYMKNIYEQLKNKVSWKMYILMPYDAINWNYFIDLPKDNNNIELYYYNKDTYNYSDKFDWYKKNWAMIHSQTVTVSAIFMSLNLNSKITYLAGADLSLHEQITVKNNIVHTKHIHFNENIEQLKLVPFWKDSNHKDTFKISEVFNIFSLMFKGFEELEDYSKYLNSKIYNVSDSSYIDSFEKYKL